MIIIYIGKIKDGLLNSVQNKTDTSTRHKQNPRYSAFLAWAFHMYATEGERAKDGRLKEDFKETYRKIRLNYFKESSSSMREMEISWQEIQPRKDSGKRK